MNIVVKCFMRILNIPFPIFTESDVHTKFKIFVSEFFCYEQSNNYIHYRVTPLVNRSRRTFLSECRWLYGV